MCPYAGRALNRLIDENPDDFLAVEHHGFDSYETTWSRSRITFLGIVSYPTTWFDGALERIGAYGTDIQTYNWYAAAIGIRRAVATDVTIALTAVERVPLIYDVTADVAIEAGGTGKTLRVRIGQLLDHYPSYADNRYRNCAIQGVAEAITLAPGESGAVTAEFRLAGPSADDLENVKFVAWAEDTGSHAPNEVYQAAQIAYPFLSGIDGDIDGDGDVDLADLAALLAAYGQCDGDPAYNPDADLTGDDCVDLSDLATLLANYGFVR